MDRHDPFTGRELQPDQARTHSVAPDPKDPRMGVPPDKFGSFAVPLQQANQRQAVMLMLFPPEALRDQPYAIVEEAIFAQGAGLLRGIAQEIFRAYTSEPEDPAATQNIAEALQRHADAMRGGR